MSYTLDELDDSDTPDCMGCICAVCQEPCQRCPGFPFDSDCWKFLCPYEDEGLY